MHVGPRAWGSDGLQAPGPRPAAPLGWAMPQPAPTAVGTQPIAHSYISAARGLKTRVGSSRNMMARCKSRLPEERGDSCACHRDVVVLHLHPHRAHRRPAVTGEPLGDRMGGQCRGLAFTPPRWCWRWPGAQGHVLAADGPRLPRAVAVQSRIHGAPVTACGSSPVLLSSLSSLSLNCLTSAAEEEAG